MFAALIWKRILNTGSAGSPAHVRGIVLQAILSQFCTVLLNRINKTEASKGKKKQIVKAATMNYSHVDYFLGDQTCNM